MRTAASDQPSLPETSSSGSTPGWLIPAMIFIGVLAYANSFAGPFIFDDIDSIPRNPQIRHLWPLRHAMASPPLTSVSGRPVVCLSLALNYVVSGLNVWSYHALNLAIHLSSALLLFSIIRRTLVAPIFSGRFERAAVWLAALTATLWMVHPLQTEAVTYVVQRTELLVGFFCLLTLYCAIRSWELPPQRWWIAASILSCALGMGSKEVMAGAPIVVLLYDRIFQTLSWREALRRHARLYVGLACTWVILAFLLSRGARAGSAGTHLRVSPLEYLMTQTGVVVWYLRLCFWPSPLVISYDDWKIAKHVSEVLPQSLLIVALLAGTIWALQRRHPAGFPGAWFFLILAPSSSIVPIVTEIAAERRMYLPLAAVIVLLVIGCYQLLNVAAKRFSMSQESFHSVGLSLALLALAALGAGTIARNRDYRSETAIWGDTAAKRPGIAFAQFEYANALFAGGEFDEAAKHFRDALQLKPEYPEAHTNFGNLLADRGQLDEAIYHYEEAIRLRPDFAEPRNNLGTVLITQGKFDRAIEQISQALRIKPGWSAALSNLGLALIRKDRLDEAIARLKDAVNADPDIVQPRLLLAEALTRSDRLDEAIEQLRACLRIDPNNSIALEKLDAAMASRDAIRGR